mmetsp:Transcript_7511/g.11057  ORF Transcript_7511/g.11057 Transcript_7511/m.11057 type:complete len:371 (-) Transcript_7511:217-1329(-)
MSNQPLIENNGGTEKSEELPRFSINELQIGSYLGEGGFCIVHSITGFRLQQHTNVFTEHEIMSRRRMALNVERNGEVQYAIKRIRNDLSAIEEGKAIADLAIESGFLARLEHDHIISMRGVADQDPYSVHYFILLDRLYETLDKRLKHKWKREVKKSSGLFWGCCANKEKLRDLWDVRLNVALNLAGAIQYLHNNGIIYRDLKPDNIGFNLNGVVKIFDFGLAKDLTTETRVDGLYQLTGNTGSLRYMAPEVSLDLMYDEKVDAYSFGILLWQICDLSVPFPGFTRKKHAELVIGKGERPRIDPSWQPGLALLISNCWAMDSYTRPDFGRIITALEEEIRVLRYADECGEHDNKAVRHSDLGKKYDAAIV